MLSEKCLGGLQPKTPHPASLIVLLLISGGSNYLPARPQGVRRLKRMVFTRPPELAEQLLPDGVR